MFARRATLSGTAPATGSSRQVHISAVRRMSAATSAWVEGTGCASTTRSAACSPLCIEGDGPHQAHQQHQQQQHRRGSSTCRFVLSRRDARCALSILFPPGSGRGLRTATAARQRASHSPTSSQDGAGEWRRHRSRIPRRGRCTHWRAARTLAVDQQAQLVDAASQHSPSCLGRLAHTWCSRPRLPFPPPRRRRLSSRSMTWRTSYRRRGACVSARMPMGRGGAAHACAGARVNEPASARPCQTAKVGGLQLLLLLLWACLCPRRHASRGGELVQALPGVGPRAQGLHQR